MGNQVLISSPNCGILLSNSSIPLTATQYDEVVIPWGAKQMAWTANYALRCYSNSSEVDAAGKGSCTPFVKNKLPSQIDRNSSCPFQDRICRNKYGNIRIDTGYLDSQDLGLNLPVELQFRFRKIFQCAPLKSNDHVKVVYHSPDRQYRRYYYGTGIADGPNETSTDYTYQIEQESAQELAYQRFLGPDADYRVTVRFCTISGKTCDEYSDFIPIKEIARTDGDVTLVFLSKNGIRYIDRTDDEWYAAHRTTNDTYDVFGAPGQEHYYLADEPASVLGCTEQYQRCDPTLPPERGCSILDGSDALFFNNRIPTAGRDIALFWGLSLASLCNVLLNLGSSSLTAKLSLSQGVQGPLPTDQWQREVENWHSIILASSQNDALEDAVGPGNDEVLKWFWARPQNDVERYICKSQKIVSTAYTNFSTMWLVIIVVVGMSIVLIEQSLETFVIWLERRNIIKTSTTEWFGNKTLQLHRMAHEELGLGDWEGCRGKEIPVTRKGQLLGIFSIADPKHPRLVNPRESIQKPESTTNNDESSQEPAVVESEAEADDDLSEPPLQDQGQSNFSHNVANDSVSEAIGSPTDALSPDHSHQVAYRGALDRSFINFNEHQSSVQQNESDYIINDQSTERHTNGQAQDADIGHFGSQETGPDGLSRVSHRQ
ncbi:MAG: hypothetical protein Q9227_003268 [Pyrenula ochraceoflavens]